MKKWFLFCTLLAVFIGPSSPSKAALISELVDVNISNIPLNISFKLSYDPSLSYYSYYVGELTRYSEFPPFSLTINSVNGVLSGASNSSEQIKERIDSLESGGVGNPGNPVIFSCGNVGFDGPGVGGCINVAFSTGVIMIGNLNSDRGPPFVIDAFYGGEWIDPVGYATVTVSPVPLPAALPLFAIAMLGFVSFAVRKGKASFAAKAPDFAVGAF